MSSAVQKDPMKKVCLQLSSHLTWSTAEVYPSSQIWMEKTGPDIVLTCDETIRHLCLVSLTHVCPRFIQEDGRV